MTLTLLVAAACGPVPERPATLPVGYDTLDGSLRVWPARGGLTGDPAAVTAITEAVRDWRSPVDDQVHLPSSGILWAGPVDGRPLALVAADVPGGSASWLLQLTGADGRYTVDRAVEYTDPGYLVYSDVLPVQSADGRRYLTSARVDRLTGPDGVALTGTDGLTGPVTVPACAAVPVTASLRATESLPQGQPAHRLLDLGSAVPAPRYPLVDDVAGTGREALAGLDTCALGTEEGPFGSLVRRDGERKVPAAAPESWPVGSVTLRPLGELPAGVGPVGELHELSWRSATGTMTAVMYRAAPGGPVAVSPADRANPLQVYEVPVPGRPVVVLAWRPGPDVALAVPPELPRLVDRPGLVVLPAPVEDTTFRLAEPGRTSDRSVDGDG
ncbi:hypothetical protein [Micromonospora echinofusca]|uniref:Lipoprotein n=1 Tax=Micromonospora echinofusca TaxID=47858 RepID=A0ABS3VUG3_MICEH|nr:hypothetical protein [Micromonospora echinofusca]MBO4208175.1 hypothetical protein [Micromonospora echinofusca]